MLPHRPWVLHSLCAWLHSCLWVSVLLHGQDIPLHALLPPPPFFSPPPFPPFPPSSPLPPHPSLLTPPSSSPPSPLSLPLTSLLTPSLSLLLLTPSLSSSSQFPSPLPSLPHLPPHPLPSPITLPPPDSAPELLDYKPKVSVCEGKQATLRVMFSGSPTPTVTWSCNGVAIVPDYATEVGSDGSLFFVCVESKHSGRYGLFG